MKRIGKIIVGQKEGNCVGVYGIAVDEEKNLLYTSNLHTPNVSIIDAARGRKVFNIQLEEREQRGMLELVRSPLTGKIYVTNQLRHFFYVVDLDERRTVKTVKTGTTPQWIVIHPHTGHLYISNYDDNTVTCYDGEKEKLIATYSVGPGPLGMDLDPERELLLVVCQKDEYLRTLDLKKGKVVGNPVKIGKLPRHVAYNPATRKAYVGSRRDWSINVIDTEKNVAVKNLPGMWDMIGMHADVERNRIYGVSRMGRLLEEIGQPGTVTVIDGEHDEVVKHVDIGLISHYLAINRKTNLMYTTNEDSLDISVLDRDTEREIGRIKDLGLTVDEMAINRNTGRIYIPSHLTFEVVVADGKKMENAASVPVGSWVSSAAVNSKTNRVYASNMDAGTITVIDGATNQIVTDIDLSVGTNKIHRCWSRIAIDESRNLVYVSLARKNGVSVINGETNALVKNIICGKEIPDIQMAFLRVVELAVAVNEKTNMIYMLNPFYTEFNVIDGESLTLKEQLNLRALRLPTEREYSPFCSLAVDTRKNLVYIWDWILDGANNRIIGRLPSELGSGVIYIDEAQNRLYCHGFNGITVADATSYKKIERLSITSEPGVESEFRMYSAIDPKLKRLYVVRQLMTTGHEIEVYSLDKK